MTAPTPPSFPLTLVIDMDGTLCHHNLSDFSDGSWLQPGFFRHRPLNRKMVEVITRAAASNFRVIICSMLDPQHPDFRQAKFDKHYWVHRHLAPELPPGVAGRIPSLVCSDNDKAKWIKPLLPSHELDPTVVLLDDYKHNCELWRAAGGTAVKYEPSWSADKTIAAIEKASGVKFAKP